MIEQSQTKVISEKKYGSISRVNTKVAADLLGVSVRTLEDWRSKGIGPKFVKIGRKILRYEIAEINAFLDKGRAIDA